MLKGVFLLILLVLLAYSLSTLERRALYFPDRRIAATPAAYRLSYENVFLQTNDGQKLHGWFIPQKNKGTAPTILFFHGNAGNISHRLDKALDFHNRGFQVLLFDYRGYGESEGKPSEKGTYLDGEAAYRFLADIQKIPARKIILYGESLGSAVAVELARQHPAVPASAPAGTAPDLEEQGPGAGAIILESPFTSTVAMGKLVYPWLPVRWLVKYRYDNLSKISELRLPILILHSPDDEIVPFRMGQRLYAAAASPKRLVELTGGHNDGYYATGKSFLDSIQTFLQDTNVLSPRS